MIAEELDEFVCEMPERQEHPQIPSYGRIYEIPFGKIIGYVFQTCGLLDEFTVLARSDNPHGEMVKFAKSAEPTVEIKPENVWPLLCAWVAMIKTLESISVFGSSMHKLITEAKAGDDEALFKAIHIDRSVLHSDVAARRVSTAEVCDDRKFFEKLSLTVKRSRPTRPKKHLNEVRLLLAVVDEMVGLESVPASDLTNWATEFELYPVDADALQAITRQKRKFQKLSSHK